LIIFRASVQYAPGDAENQQLPVKFHQTKNTKKLILLVIFVTQPDYLFLLPLTEIHNKVMPTRVLCGGYFTDI